jgi:hypothetical protein
VSTVCAISPKSGKLVSQLVGLGIVVLSGLPVKPGVGFDVLSANAVFASSKVIRNVVFNFIIVMIATLGCEFT